MEIRTSLIALLLAVFAALSGLSNLGTDWARTVTGFIPMLALLPTVLPDIDWRIVLLLLSLVATILSHRFLTAPTAADIESDLEDRLDGEVVASTTTSNGHEFSLKVVAGSFEVYEQQGFVYRYLLKPVVKFWGETQVLLDIQGDVFIEDGVLAKEIASDEDTRRMIGEMRLEDSQITLVINSASVGEVRDTLSGISELADLDDEESLLEETVQDADHRILGVKAAGGVARPIVVDIWFANRHMWRIVSVVYKRWIQNTVGEMNRTYVWVRRRPRKKTSQTTVRFRHPDTTPVEYQLGALQLISFLNPFSPTPEGSQQILDLLHMGTGIRRDFIEPRGDVTTVERNGITHLSITLTRSENTTDSLDSRVGLTEWGSKLLAKVAWSGEYWNKDKVEVLIPIVGLEVDDFEGVDEDKSILDSIEMGDGTSIWAESITAINGRSVRCYYRGNSGSWYIVVEWLPDGSSRVVDSGEVKPQTPIPTEGHILWQRLHLGRKKAYYDSEYENTTAYYVVHD